MPNINPTIVVAILAAFGIGLAYLIDVVKKLFKASGTGALIVSFVVTAGVTAATLAVSSMFNVLNLILYTIVVWLEVTGVYGKFIKKK